jgi:hypothetical protein
MQYLKKGNQNSHSLKIIQNDESHVTATAFKRRNLLQFKDKRLITAAEANPEISTPRTRECEQQYARGSPLVTGALFLLHQAQVDQDKGFHAECSFHGQLRECCVVSTADTYGSILGFLNRHGQLNMFLIHL